MEAIINGPVGYLRLSEENNSLTKISFIKGEATIILPENELLKNTTQQLNEYFSGSRHTFDLPLNPTGTEFQLKVWQELGNIPYGITLSYQEIANRLGDPKCIRAAARANGQNPIAIIIPCHRVIGSRGDMVGYAGGIERKKFLLAHEGAAVMNQMNLF